MSINRFNRGNSLSRITGSATVSTAVAGPLNGGNAANGLQPGNGFTYHTFTSTGTISISAGPSATTTPSSLTYSRTSKFIQTTYSSSQSKTVQVLLVGGGGGGYSQSGGGGGGIVHYTNLTINGPMTVTVGGGGAVGAKGGDTALSSPTMTTLSALGGGYWDYTTPTPVNRARVVGSGAGFTPDASGKNNNTPAAPQILQPTQNPSYAGLPGFNQYGNQGGGGYAQDYQWQGGGGGGAGGNGNNSPRFSETSGGPSGNSGGSGLTVAPGTPSPAFHGSIIGVPSIAPLNGTYAGGGGGNNENYPTYPAPFGSSGGSGGGGTCQGPSSGSTNAVQYSGSGGAAQYGGWYNPNPGPAGTGGDGIVIIRYT